YKAANKLVISWNSYYRIAKTTSGDTKSSSQSWRVSSNARYPLFKRISVDAEVFYGRARTLPIREETKREVSGVKGGLTYSRRIQFWRIVLSARYQPGLSRVVTTFPSGEKETKTEVTHEGDIRLSTDGLGINRNLRSKYLTFSPAYLLYVNRTFFPEDSLVIRHYFTLKVRSINWKQTRFQSDLAYSIEDANTNDKVNITDIKSFIRHSRVVGRGMGRFTGRLTLNVRVDYNKKDSKDIMNRARTLVSYSANYKLSPFRNTRLTIDLERKESYTNGLKDTTDTIKTILLYRLRAWFLEAEYSHAIGDRQQILYTEDRMFFSVSRSFGRTF
ncbi:MAG: hypothetical protein ACE5IH_05835, partial [Thermodesulfobacteriota bacterium]